MNKPLQMRWQFDDSEGSRWNGNKPAKKVTSTTVSWNDLTQEEKTGYFHLTSLSMETQSFFNSVLFTFRKYVFAQTSDGNPAIACRSCLHPSRFYWSIQGVCIFYNINHKIWINLWKKNELSKSFSAEKTDISISSWSLLVLTVTFLT